MAVTKIVNLGVLASGEVASPLLDADAVKALATMPSREELLATLLGTMQAPIATFVRTLNEVPAKSSLLFGRSHMNAIKRKARTNRTWLQLRSLDL